MNVLPRAQIARPQKEPPHEQSLFDQFMRARWATDRRPGTKIRILNILDELRTPLLDRSPTKNIDQFLLFRKR